MILLALTFILGVAPRDHMKDALDDMQKHYDGKNAQFDPKFYHKLVQCFNKYDDEMLRKS